jgi:beta-galactosidase/beta-glucuronidase
MANQPYPRPDWVRPNNSWTLLNGEWDFRFDDKDEGLSDGWQHSGLEDNRGSSQSSSQTIKVPFAFQTSASGINDRGAHEIVWYSKKLDGKALLAVKASRRRCLVRFGAVDYEVQVWLEGHFVGSHRGGHVGFDVDITEAIKG